MVAVRRDRRLDGGGFVEGGGREALQPPVRRDSLPEHTRYADTGCSVHPSCLSCPLVRCRYEEPDAGRGALSRVRDEAILGARREESLPIQAVARRFGVSRRTVFRVLAKARDGGGATWF
jgi:transcriptional regulator of acetoin/glycerol metabolism